MTTTPFPVRFDVFRFQKSLRGSNLSAPTRHVALALSTYANAKSGMAWPSQDTLAGDTGWSRRRVGQALDELAEAGWLTRAEAGARGRTTRYRLHVPGDTALTGKQVVTAAVLRCTSEPDGVQQTAREQVATCTPTPQGELLHEEPRGGLLARPKGVDDALWYAAVPTLDGILGRLSAGDVDRFAEGWTTLAKARDFVWQLGSLTGRNPRGQASVRWTDDALAAVLTDVPFTGINAVAPALYQRLRRVADGLPPVQPAEAALPRPRLAWEPPEGVVADALAVLADSLSMPPEYRAASRTA